MLRALVDKFRSLGAFVLILTAETNEPALNDLDFVVDFVVRLEHSTRGETEEEPVRRFILKKTRLQYSRPGAHIFHISKRDGVKIYPQLAAQLDALAYLKWRPVDKKHWFDFLQTALHAMPETPPLVKFY